MTEQKRLTEKQFWTGLEKFKGEFFIQPYMKRIVHKNNGACPIKVVHEDVIGETISNYHVLKVYNEFKWGRHVTFAADGIVRVGSPQESKELRRTRRKLIRVLGLEK